MEVPGAQDGQDSQRGPGREQRTEINPRGWGVDWGWGESLSKGCPETGKENILSLLELLIV